MATNSQAPFNIQAFASAQAESVVAAIRQAPDDIGKRQAMLDDIKILICRHAAQSADSAPGETLLWGIAQQMPSFSTAALYHPRASLLSLTSAVLLGWFIGGLLSTLLGFLSLGGEILRPAAIIAVLWLEDYLAANAKARRILLTVLGLGALGRFAAAITAGISRLASLGSLRQLIFGAGRSPNIFKAGWLWFGAIFLYIFFAKRTAAPDLGAFKASLEEQIIAKYELMLLLFQELGRRDAQLTRQMSGTQNAAAGVSAESPLAEAAISLLDTLGPEQRKFLASALSLSGIDIKDQDKEYLYWDSARDSGRYQPIGLVRDGDKCLILERPRESGGKLIRGRVQREAA